MEGLYHALYNTLRGGGGGGGGGGGEMGCLFNGCTDIYNMLLVEANTPSCILLPSKYQANRYDCVSRGMGKQTWKQANRSVYTINKGVTANSIVQRKLQ